MKVTGDVLLFMVTAFLLAHIRRALLLTKYERHSVACSIDLHGLAQSVLCPGPARRLDGRGALPSLA
jgi:hypothetical protein